MFSPHATPLSSSVNLLLVTRSWFAFGKWTKTHFCTFILFLDSWDFMTSMTTNRCYAVAAWCKGKLYVIGGCDGRSVLSCGEMYDPNVNYWRPIPLMNTPRMKSGIAVYDEQIYVFGGVSDLGQTILSSVECYNPSGNRWTFVSPLPTESFDLQCCAVEIPYKSVASVMIDE